MVSQALKPRNVPAMSLYAVFRRRGRSHGLKSNTKTSCPRGGGPGGGHTFT